MPMDDTSVNNMAPLSFATLLIRMAKGGTDKQNLDL